VSWSEVSKVSSSYSVIEQIASGGLYVEAGYVDDGYIESDPNWANASLEVSGWTVVAGVSTSWTVEASASTDWA